MQAIPSRTTIVSGTVAPIRSFSTHCVTRRLRPMNLIRKGKVMKELFQMQQPRNELRNRCGTAPEIRVAAELFDFQ